MSEAVVAEAMAIVGIDRSRIVDAVVLRGG